MKINEVINSKFQNVGLGAGDQVITAVEKYCQNYLIKIGGVKNALFLYPLWRGMEKFKFPENQQIMKTRVNQNRLPLDTTMVLHKAADNWFRLATGIPFRSTSFFASGRYNVARSYAINGEVTVVIPIGNYHYCWSPIYQDAYEELGHFVWNIDHWIGRDKDKTTEFLLRHPAKITQFLNKGKYKVDTRLLDALNSSHEIMINCKKAILINMNWINSHGHENIQDR